MRYGDLVEVYEDLEGTSKRLAKTYYISAFLKKIKTDEMEHLMLLLQGRVFPVWDERKIGVASRLVIKSINLASGMSVAKIETEWRKVGDLGEVAKNLIKRKTQATLVSIHLSTSKVFDNLVKLASAEGKGSVDVKVKLIAELLTSAGPDEAKYIVRTVLEELRVGVASGTLRDAIAWAYLYKVKYNEKKKSIDLSAEERVKYNEAANAVQGAYDVTNDFAVVAKVAKTKGLKGLSKVNLKLGNPVKVMLYLKAKDMHEAFKRIGTPLQVEYKYDGFRVQVHKDAGKISVYTRRLEDVTAQFPDIVDVVKGHVKGRSFILDAEAIGYDRKSGKYLPFQNISQRIKRKYNIDEMAKKFPVELNVFDMLYYNGKNLLDEPFSKRRGLIERIVKPRKRSIVPAACLVTSEVKEAEKFYKEALKLGNEGVMVKKLDAIYKPGARVGYGMKVKPVMESLDLAVVGAEWGEGKRKGWLSSLVLACKNKKGEFVEIGKVGTGLKEKEKEGVTFQQVTDLLKPLIIKESGRSVRVRPSLVIEIRYEEIQKSPTYSSGYALRFPRVVRIRDDRAPDEINTLEDVEVLYKQQK